jgi:hypothetical protein
MRIRILFYIDEAEESERGGKPERVNGGEDRLHAHGRRKFRPAKGPTPPRAPIGPPETTRDR